MGHEAPGIVYIYTVHHEPGLMKIKKYPKFRHFSCAPIEAEEKWLNYVYSVQLGGAIH